MKIVLITRDRPELTRQTIETMKANAADWSRHMLTVVFDGTDQEFIDYPLELDGDFELINIGKQLGVGGAKNLGVKWFESDKNDTTRWSEDEIIMFSDNDMYYLPDWDKKLEEGLANVTQLGGWKHPYHGLPIDAVTGNCFVIRYSAWLKFGPFDSNALGVGQSEDFALSQRILSGGGTIATLEPPVAVHCGLRDSSGNPATGWVEMAAMAEKQIEANNINKIWLEVPDEGTILLEKQDRPVFRGLNVGSGQRRFDNNRGWTNVDVASRPPDQVPDVILDATKLVEHFGENTQDMVVLHHVIEHFGCGEADEVLKQCFKVLKSGGSLLIFVPDMRRLAGRWLSGELDDFSYFVNVYGAYQGLEGDRHKWGYDTKTLHQYLSKIPGTGQIKLFDWREIPGADIARDWWILGMEIVKA